MVFLPRKDTTAGPSSELSTKICHPEQPHSGDGWDFQCSHTQGMDGVCPNSHTQGMGVPCKAHPEEQFPLSRDQRHSAISSFWEVSQPVGNVGKANRAVHSQHTGAAPALHCLTDSPALSVPPEQLTFLGRMCL